MDKEDLYEKQGEDPSLRIDRTRFQNDNSLYYEKKPLSRSEQSEREQKQEMQWKANVEAAKRLQSDWLEEEQRAKEVEARRRRDEQRQAEEKAAKWREDLRQKAATAKIRRAVEEAERQRVAQAQRPIQKPAAQAQRPIQKPAAQAQRPIQKPTAPSPTGAGSSGAGCILPILGIIAFIAILPFLIQFLIIAVPIVIVGGIIFAVIAALFSKN